MKVNLTHVIPVLVIASATLTAQVARQGNVIPLKNWTAPQYWLPNQAETRTSGRAQPQLQFSANAVSTNALTFIAITPCRLVDTRGGSFNGISPFSGPSIPAMGAVTFPVQSPTEATTNTAPAPCGTIPPNAQAYSFNLTVVPHAGGAVDYVSLWPDGAPQPFVSTLDDPQGTIVSNAAVVPAGSDGGISVFNAGPATTDIILDMNGFYAAPSDGSANTAIGAGSLMTSNGMNNTAVGFGVLEFNTIGSYNTASGALALYANTTGGDDTAMGAFALESNTTGNYNTAIGESALADNSTGAFNTATGHDALAANTTGERDTANGQNALFANTIGNSNTANGQNALFANTIGNNNTASGQNALAANTTGNFNTASGVGALFANTTGGGNTAAGDDALLANTTGGNNTAIGNAALADVTTGSSNIGIGQGAGRNVSVGNSNIHIGNVGVAGDSATIKIGTQGTQTSAFIAGISGVTSSGGIEVFVNSSGQLGTANSSRRFKEEITDMGDTSSKLLQLRPVTFFYKPEYDDGSHLLQYGLIAEEVAKVYPEMVAYDHDGQILTVRYQMLAPMLLNEAQKQNAKVENLEEQNQQQIGQIHSLEDRLAALEALLSSQAATESRQTGSQ